MSPRTVVITGANRGLGLALAKAFSAQPNTQVIGTARNPAAATELAKLPNVHVVDLDISDLDSIPKLADKVSKIAPDGVDILWNNAGAASQAVIPVEVNPVLFLDDLKVNVVAQTVVVQTILPLLRKKKTKKIIFMGSILGSVSVVAEGQQTLVDGGEWAGPSNVTNLVYSTTKAGVSISALYWSGYLRPEGFTVTPIHPGWVRTDMGSAAADITADVSIKGMLEVVEKLTPADEVLLRTYDGSSLPW